MKRIEEDKLAAIFAGAIARAIFYICITVIFCFGLAQCGLDTATIESCRESCDTHRGQMKSVTTVKCVCSTDEEISIIESPMVLP
tara:strand:- start:282 stop:536 length:255 start_codon:yes stop_codon:yes gene_type:complete